MMTVWKTDSHQDGALKGHFEKIPFAFDHPGKDTGCRGPLTMHTYPQADGSLRVVPEWNLSGQGMAGYLP